VHIEQLVMARDALTQCHECGLLQRNPPLPAGDAARCVRCDATLHRNIPDSLDRTLALTVAGIVLFVVANSFPFLSFQLQGQTTETTLFTGVKDLYGQGMWELSLVVFFTSILAPGIQLTLLMIVLVPLKMNRLPRGFPTLFRYVATLTPWGMMGVFMLGILVSVVTLADLATIIPGTSRFAFAVLIFSPRGRPGVLGQRYRLIPGTGSGSRSSRPAAIRVRALVSRLRAGHAGGRGPACAWTLTVDLGSDSLDPAPAGWYPPVPDNGGCGPLVHGRHLRGYDTGGARQAG
jgi:hypothetical protein